jgi:hypothetical protein
MSKFIDLSGPLLPGLWSYNALPGFSPRLPELAVEQVATLDSHGFEAFRFELSSLTGSYIETGRHMLADAPLLEELARRKAECGIPFWPHAFVTAECDVDALLQAWNNEYAVLGYGAHLFEDLVAFCELAGIKAIPL